MRQAAGWKRFVIRLVTLVMLIGLAGFFLPGGLASADIKKAPKLAIGPGIQMPSVYRFVPEYGDGSSIETFGGQVWHNTTWDSSDTRKFKSLEVTNPSNRDNLKGKVGVTYKKIGTFNGKSVDLRITVTDWQRWGNPGKSGNHARVGNISFENERIAMSTQGFSWVDTTWQYVVSGTTTAINTSGYFTFSDVDVNQSLQFSNRTSSSIKQYMIANTSNKLQYKRVGSQDNFFDTTDTDRPDKTYDQNHAFTFTYGNLNSFDVRWSTDWSKTRRSGSLVSKDRYYYTNPAKHAAGEYMFYVTNKPAQTIIPEATKDGPTSTKKPGDVLKYTVSHNVPEEDPKWYYNNLNFVDKLDPALTYKTNSWTVHDDIGRNVKDYFTGRLSGQVLTVTATAAALNDPNFYGNTYHLTLEATVDPKKLGSATSYTVKNKAVINLNKITRTTNEVRTPVENTTSTPTPPVTPPAPKSYTLTINHVDDETGDLIERERKTFKDGTRYSESPRYDLKKGSQRYTPKSTAAKTGTINGRNVTIEFRYVLPSPTPTPPPVTPPPVNSYTLTINHVDDATGALIVRDQKTLKDGTRYTEYPRNDLKKGTQLYTPKSTAGKTGTINGRNASIEFRYILPPPPSTDVPLTVQHIDDKTNRVITQSTKMMNRHTYFSELPLYNLKSGTETYIPLSTKAQTGSSGSSGVTIQFRYKLPGPGDVQHQVTVYHQDSKTGRDIVPPTTKMYYHGASYFETFRTNLSSGGVPYAPTAATRDSSPRTGTITGNTSMYFRYELPPPIAYHMQVNHVDDVTGEFISGTTPFATPVKGFSLYEGQTYEEYPHVGLMKGGRSYVATKSVLKGVVGKKGVTLEFRYKLSDLPPPVENYTLTIEHVDKETGQNIITPVKKTVKKDETYIEYPRDNLKKGKRIYRPTKPSLTGKMTGNKTIRFEYELATLNIGIDRIQIDTAKVTSGGLPTIVDFAKVSPDGGSLAEFYGAEVRFEVVDTTNDNKVVHNKVYKTEDLPDTLTMKLTSNYLTKGEKTNYDFKLTSLTADAGVEISTPKTTTYGYASSEEVYTLESMKNDDDTNDDKLFENLVIMTEKLAGQPVKDTLEILEITPPKLAPQKTGYGFKAELTAKYTNHLGELWNVTPTGFLAEKALVDSQLTYEAVGDDVLVPFEQKSGYPKTVGNSREFSYELPKIYVEKITGDLYTKAQVDSGEPTYEALDGGRQLYVPIWAYAGEDKMYDYGVKSSEAIGVHAVTFDFTNQLNVYAHMYSHIESPTESADELLVRPLNKGEVEDLMSEWSIGRPE